MNYIDLAAVESGIRRAENRSGRSEFSAQLIAVSKTQPKRKIDEARGIGLRQFGENKVQEAIEKFSPPEQRWKSETLHLIGPLQSNKARQAMQHFDWIHSLDRSKLVSVFARISQEIGSCPDLLIQVNTGEEHQKAGVLPQDLEALLLEAQRENLPVRGLMCIPPADQAPAPHFAWLARRAQDLSLPELSMGMSQDFEAAVELGATFVRVGSRLFGARS